MSLQQAVGNTVQRFITGLEGFKLWSNITVVKAVVVDTDLVHELEEDVDPVDGIFHGVTAIIPGHLCSAGTEGVAKGIAHHMPIGCSETHVFLHGFTANCLVGIVLLEGQWIF